MRELSLFTGIGGGLLGTHGLLGWECVGAVEWEAYPCKVLAQRQEDGILDDFPIWNMDIRRFNERVAPSYTGLVDVISAGFPCQPFSLAGKQRGADDERNQWPATIASIRIVQPRFCFLENVPGLISSGYLGTILGDLAACGYDARWRVLSAAELGAPHKRDRLWIVADANENSSIRQTKRGAMERRVCVCKRDETQYGPRSIFEAPWPPRPVNVDTIPRMVSRDADRMDRVSAIGNGQVPAVAAAAWLLLTGAE